MLLDTQIGNIVADTIMSLCSLLNFNDFSGSDLEFHQKVRGTNSYKVTKNHKLIT